MSSSRVIGCHAFAVARSQQVSKGVGAVVVVLIPEPMSVSGMGSHFVNLVVGGPDVESRIPSLSGSLVSSRVLSDVVSVIVGSRVLLRQRLLW